MLIFVLFQSIGATLSIVLHVAYLSQGLEDIPDSFMLYPYLISTLFSFGLIGFVSFLYKIKPGWLIQIKKYLKKYQMKKKFKIKIILDWDSFEYIKSTEKQENKNTSQFANDIFYQYIKSCNKQITLFILYLPLKF